jgi:hypothetical protein
MNKNPLQNTIRMAQCAAPYTLPPSLAATRRGFPFYVADLPSPIPRIHIKMITLKKEVMINGNN